MSKSCVLSCGPLANYKKELQAGLPHCKPEPPNPEIESQLQKPPLLQPQSEGTTLEFPSTMERFIIGATRTSKAEFFELLDIGVPIDLPKEGESDILLLHQRKHALPVRFSEYSEPIPSLEAKEALQNCDYVHVILTDHSKGRNQCLAIVPQYESYVVQKWMRIPEDKPHGAAMGSNLLNSSLPLRLVGRAMKTNGFNDFLPPLTKDMRQNWDLLSNYFSSFEAVMNELKPLVERVATPQKTITVMVSNFGQSELLVNFACAAKSRRLDTSSILVFATDIETKTLAEHLGLTAFYDERVSSKNSQLIDLFQQGKIF